MGKKRNYGGSDSPDACFGGPSATAFALVATEYAGGSGSFNYYTDLGERLPSHDGSAADDFTTLVGNNGGSWLGHPVVLQHWRNTPAGLQLARNSTAILRGTPPQFSGACAASGPQQRCGLAQGGTIVRDSEGSLVAAFTGFASDGPTLCKPNEAGWKHCYTLAFYRSGDNGSTWNYMSRLDQTQAMPSAVEGPCEPTLALLADGRLLLMFRLMSGVNLWQAFSDTGARTWTEPTQSVAWAVWPQLLRLSSGVLALSSGRPGIGLWLSADGAGEHWEYHSVCAEHNRHLPAESGLRYNAEMANVSSNSSSQGPSPGQTTSYTSLVEVSPGVVMLQYDRMRVGCTGTADLCGRDFVFSMRIRIDKNS